MNKLSAVVIALAFGGTIATVYGAQPLGTPGPGVLASADPTEVQSSGGKVDQPGREIGTTAEKPTGSSVKAAGPHPDEPGISNDPISAEKPGIPTGGGVKAAGPHPDEPGRSNDPVSAEKPQK